MFVIAYYDVTINRDIIIEANSVFEIIYKKYMEKYKNDKTHNYRITVM